MRRLLLVLATCAFMVGCSKDSQHVAKWEQVSPSFSLGGSTSPITVKNGRLPDGTYWATVHRVLNSDTIVFRLAQARFGKTCDAWARDNGMSEGCTNDYAIDEFTTELLAVNDSNVVTVADVNGPGKSFDIDFSTLNKLVRGIDVDVPEGYSWASFPFILTMKNGKPTEINQFWVP